MSLKIVNNRKNRKIVDDIFKNAPKSFKEALKKGKLLPIPIGIKHDDYIKNSIRIECDSNKKKEITINL